jgi:uncharacterized OB-fold protein
MSDYLRASDPYPLQGEKSTRLAPFYEALRQGKLMTTVCGLCHQRHWPPRLICPSCVSDRLKWTELPTRGTIHAFTIQETGVPPGFPRPLIFAVVDLGGVRVFTRLVETDPAVVQRGVLVQLHPSLVNPDPQGAERYLPTFRVTRNT